MQAYRHEEHGQLTIRRRPKAVDEAKVVFDISLVGNDGKVTCDVFKAFANNRDGHHGGRSTLGFDDIYLDPALQGKGVGTACLAELARAGQALGVELIGIDTVVAEPMHRLAQQLGARDSQVMDSYELEPGALLLNARTRAAGKGWT